MSPGVSPRPSLNGHAAMIYGGSLAVVSPGVSPRPSLNEP